MRCLKVKWDLRISIRAVGWAAGEPWSAEMIRDVRKGWARESHGPASPFVAPSFRLLSAIRRSLRAAWLAASVVSIFWLFCCDVLKEKARRSSESVAVNAQPETHGFGSASVPVLSSGHHIRGPRRLGTPLYSACPCWVGGSSLYCAPRAHLSAPDAIGLHIPRRSMHEQVSETLQAFFTHLRAL